MSPVEDPVLEQLLRLTRITADLGTKVDHVSAAIETQRESIAEIRDTCAELRHRTADHTIRITALEDRTEKHSDWKARLGGVYLGVAVTVTTLTGIGAIWRIVAGR